MNEWSDRHENTVAIIRASSSRYATCPSRVIPSQTSYHGTSLVAIFIPSPSVSASRHPGGSRELAFAPKRNNLTSLADVRRNLGRFVMSH